MIDWSSFTISLTSFTFKISLSRLGYPLDLGISSFLMITSFKIMQLPYCLACVHILLLDLPFVLCMARRDNLLAINTSFRSVWKWPNQLLSIELIRELAIYVWVKTSLLCSKIYKSTNIRYSLFLKMYLWQYSQKKNIKTLLICF